MSLAASTKPSRGVGLGGGWLSMAPQTDDHYAPQQPFAVVEAPVDSALASPVQHSPAQRSPIVPPPRASHGGLQPQPSAQSTQQAGRSQDSMRGPSAIPRRVLPRTNARFSVGDSGSMLASPASPAPTSPPYSHGSGDGDHSPPPFDVRNSFAPMQWGNEATVNSRRTSHTDRDGTSGNRLMQGQNSICDPSEDARAVPRKRDVMRANEDGDSDGERVEYAGRKWKGKTANAIEQEMEALGDRTVMSYAPDAVYLASRLEGLRRNLEAGGDRFRRWAWEDMEEVEEGKREDATEAGLEIAMESKRPEALVEDSVAEAKISLSSSPARASPLRLSHRPSMILSPVNEVPVDPLDSAPQADGRHNLTNGSEADITMDDRRSSERAAKEAALDARVEIRTLRRPDLEQVRELHCYHGDGDKVSNEVVPDLGWVALFCFILGGRGSAHFILNIQGGFGALTRPVASAFVMFPVP